jgi:DNA polymerase (family 10)
MDKHTVAKILNDIGLFLELKGENPFKSRAYYNGARIIEYIEDDLEILVKEDKLKNIKGIGSALNEKIRELVITGSLQYYEELKSSIPQGLLDLLRIPGLGPKKLKLLYEKLNITSVAELEYACKENRLVDLKGFGIKTQNNILKNIEYIKRFQNQYLYSEALMLAAKLLEELSECPDVQEISLAGSIRRSKEIIKDIDLVAASENPSQVAEYFSKIPGVVDVMALGDTKVTVKLEEGINADLRIVNPKQFPYALHHFTGSKEHNTALRQRAKTMGMKINEYGLFKVNKEEKLIECADEREFFNQLGLDYIPPELRENIGEIEAAAEGKIPKLITHNDLKGIFHIHTTYSDGSNTIEEMIQACINMGYEYIGITDHSQSAFYARGLSLEEIKRQQEEINILREKYPEIEIFSGIESDIKPDGSLDYPDSILETFDFIIASVHSNLKMSKEKATKRLINAMSHPNVTMLGHPSGRILLGREGYPLDMDEIFNAALKYNVVLEINASPARLDIDWRYLKRAKELGVIFSINPDAHRIEELQDVYFGIAVARKGWLEKSDVLNTKSRQEVRKFLTNKKL